MRDLLTVMVFITAFGAIFGFFALLIGVFGPVLVEWMLELRCEWFPDFKSITWRCE